MRFIQTFVLHLYIDSEAPERVCGNVRALEDSASYPFKSQVEFEALLYRLVRQRSTPQPPPPDGDISPEI
jgi:hypothetical protein